MPSISEQQLNFHFPENWLASKIDAWQFYRHQFSRLGNNAQQPCAKSNCPGVIRCDTCHTEKFSGVKAIDILALEPRTCAWNIEVKDYRVGARTKVIDLADEVALKVRDSLAMIAAAQINANDSGEKACAAKALRCRQLRVVLHLEQPAKHSKLFPRAIDPAKVQQRLRQLVKAVDPHPLVLESGRMAGVPWTVS